MTLHPAAPPPRALVLGCAGAELSAKEAGHFAAADPLGFILFQRNCPSPDAVRALVGQLRAAVGRLDAPIFIDQEGGRVARLGPPHWPEMPAAAMFGRLAATDLALACEAAELAARLTAHHLAELGINVNCAPVLDLSFAETTAAIGDRAYAADPHIVSELGRAVCRGLIDGGVLPVIKHLPGHGRAARDSHEGLPRVEADFAALAAADFAPFAALADMPLGMTAHILFSDLDAARPATQSKIVIDRAVRGEIGFDGLLVSDDISMHALEGDIADRAGLAWAAGCDIVLHCNGRLEEMQALAGVAPRLDDRAERRWRRARDMVSTHDPRTLDVEGAQDRLAGLLKQ